MIIKISSKLSKLKGSSLPSQIPPRPRARPAGRRGAAMPKINLRWPRRWRVTMRLAECHWDGTWESGKRGRNENEPVFLSGDAAAPHAARFHFLQHLLCCSF